MDERKSSDLNITSELALNDGNGIPMLGFGTFQIEDGKLCEEAVLCALEAGYRHIDTAFVYENEGSVGRAVADSGIPREDIYITTKTPFQLTPDRIREVFQGSLERLRTEYVDLYLIHWPMNDDLIVSAWETLEELQAEGRCRSIGVSNFTVARFEQAFLPGVSTVPAVNQVECHVFNQRRELRNYCSEKGIAIEAYSPLTRGQRLDDPAVGEIASECGKSVPQVMIRYLLQRGIVVLAKSATADHIRQNAEVFDFELTSEQMHRLDGLNEDLEVQDWHPQGYY